MEFVQTQAPDVKLQDQDKKEQTLAAYKGQWVLLYFYPKDATPGCTVEAEGFRDYMNDLAGQGVQVLGVSGDSCQSHKKFAEKHQLNFPLLADTDFELSKAYNVYREKKMFGKTFMGIVRESFLINPKGIIIRHYEKVKPETHPQEVLADVAELKQVSS